MTTFKVKVGRAPKLDVAAVRAIRDALPPADLYVDANRGWSYADAVRAGDELAELGVRAIEEPISIEDRAGRRRLAERWVVPLGGDESCISLAHVDRALEEGAVRVVSVKTARTGFTESRRILDLCLARNAGVVVGSQYEGALGATATVAFAAAFAATARQPAELTNFLDLTDELKARGREYSQAAQRDGRWPHLWRVAGRYANVSVLDVGSVDELHELLSGLPLFPYLDIRVTPPARHPNAIDRGEN